VDPELHIGLHVGEHLPDQRHAQETNP
jgi:hypothetical protein